MRTRMSGGVGAGRAILPATRLPGFNIRNSRFAILDIEGGEIAGNTFTLMNASAVSRQKIILPIGKVEMDVDGLPLLWVEHEVMR